MATPSNPPASHAHPARPQARGTCLSSNQVQYSLIYRAPEQNGVLEACREHGVTLVAYSPLCQVRRPQRGAAQRSATQRVQGSNVASGMGPNTGQQHWPDMPPSALAAATGAMQQAAAWLHLHMPLPYIKYTPRLCPLLLRAC